MRGKLMKAPRPSPATVIACVALIVAVGGTAASALGGSGPGARKSGEVDVDRSKGIVVRQNSVDFPEQVPGDGKYETRNVQVNCKSNEVATGGGSFWGGGGAVTDDRDEQTSYVAPLRSTSGVPYGYLARGRSDYGVGTERFTVFVTCLKFSKPPKNIRRVRRRDSG